MPQADHTPVEKKLNTWAVPEPLVLMMDEQTQSRCAGFIEAEIERFADDKMDQTASQEAAAADGMSDEDEDDEAWNADKGRYVFLFLLVFSCNDPLMGNRSAPSLKTDETDQAKLAQNNRFISTVSRFIMGLRLDIISTQHADIIFAYHGRFGGEYDVICKALAEELRFVACTTSRGGQVAKVVISSMEKVCAVRLAAAPCLHSSVYLVPARSLTDVALIPPSSPSSSFLTVSLSKESRSPSPNFSPRVSPFTEPSSRFSSASTLSTSSTSIPPCSNGSSRRSLRPIVEGTKRSSGRRCSSSRCSLHC
jgi:hypothetical protein